MNSNNKPAPTFKLGDIVRKTKGAQWHGRVVGQQQRECWPALQAALDGTQLPPPARKLSH